MASTLNHAAANALRIAAEMYQQDFMWRPDDPRFAQVTQAAAVLAYIEEQIEFAWNEGQCTDWETACARIAQRIEMGKTTPRRFIISATRSELARQYCTGRRR